MTNNQLQSFLVEQGFKESGKSTANNGFGFNETKSYKNVHGVEIETISCKSISMEGLETEKTIIRVYKDNACILTNTNINKIDSPEDLLKILGCRFENTPVEIIDPKKNVYFLTYLTKEGKHKNIIVESAKKEFELVNDLIEEIKKREGIKEKKSNEDFIITGIFNASKV